MGSSDPTAEEAIDWRLFCARFYRDGRVKVKTSFFTLENFKGVLPISLFPNMCADSGIAFSDLLDQLITFAFEKHQTRQALKVE